MNIEIIQARVSKAALSASLGKLSEMRVLGSFPRPTESEILGIGPRNVRCNKLSKQPWCTGQSENHRLRSTLLPFCSRSFFFMERGGACPVCCWMFNSIPRLNLLDASRTPPPVTTMKKYVQTLTSAPCVGIWELSPLQDHYSGARSPAFLAPEPGFLEDSFSTVQCWGSGGGFGMIQAHYIHCALSFYSDSISSTSGHQALDPGGWGPLLQSTLQPWLTAPSAPSVSSFLSLLPLEATALVTHPLTLKNKKRLLQS